MDAHAGRTKKRRPARHAADRLVETVGAHRQQPLERITEHVISAVQDWIGSTEQPDDITLVLARRI